MHQGSSSTPAGLAGRQFYLALITISLGIAVSVLDTTSVTLGLPTMARDLGVSADEAIWIVNGFQLAALVALLPLANLGERISYRRVYLVGVALWGLASVLASLAQSLPLLVAARVAQGLSAAGIMAVNMALVRLTWHPTLLGRGIALNSVVVSSATVLGPLVAAVILSNASWRWLFAVNVPACVLLLVLGYRSLPGNPPAKGASSPSWADIVLNTSLFLLLFLAAESFGRSVKSPQSQAQGLVFGAVLLALGGLVAVVHGRRQWNRAHALLPVDLLRIPVFRLSMLTSVGSFAAQTITYIALPFLLLEVWRTTPSQAGFLMSCWPVGTIAAAALASRWIGRYHSGALGGLGLGLLAVGLVALAWMTRPDGQASIVAWSLVLCGVGFGLFQSPNNHTIITSAPAHRSGAASGMLGTARLTGQTLGATVAATVFAIHGAGAQGLGAALLVAGTLAALAGVASGLRVRHRRV